jgi:ADP-ribose pyrophosphatase YjhB (NUDIX family)
MKMPITFNYMKLSVVVIVKFNESILMYNRGNSLNEEWTVLGGHMNEGESIFECAKREVLEEANIEIYNLKFLTILEDVVS